MVAYIGRTCNSCPQRFSGRVETQHEISVAAANVFGPLNENGLVGIFIPVHHLDSIKKLWKLMQNNVSKL